VAVVTGLVTVDAASHLNLHFGRCGHSDTFVPCPLAVVRVSVRTAHAQQPNAPLPLTERFPSALRRTGQAWDARDHTPRLTAVVDGNAGDRQLHAADENNRSERAPEPLTNGQPRLENC
jgi:hypothetical protein